MNTSGHAAAATFDPLRPKLIRIAYRMLGSVADAEDVCHSACNFDPLSWGIGVQN
jgi:RNA polymerase sigma-70 factor (ECF subfamily)